VSCSAVSPLSLTTGGWKQDFSKLQSVEFAPVQFKSKLGKFMSARNSPATGHVQKKKEKWKEKKRSRSSHVAPVNQAGQCTINTWWTTLPKRWRQPPGQPAGPARWYSISAPHSSLHQHDQSPLFPARDQGKALDKFSFTPPDIAAEISHLMVVHLKSDYIEMLNAVI